LDSQARKQQQECEQQPAAGVPEGGGAVCFAVFRQCLEVSFVYQHCLLFIRQEAFDKDKKCEWVALELTQRAAHRAACSFDGAAEAS
jgi:hypothetical protein